MKKTLHCCALRNFSNKSLNAITVIQYPSKITSRLEDKSKDHLSLLDLLKSDVKNFNTRTIVDILHSGAYKYEDATKVYDESVYYVTKNEKLSIYYLYLLSKSLFLKHDQMIPLIRSYDIFELSIFNEKCWEIIGRILNNCINVFTDSELIEICYHLTRIKSISRNSRELEVFWQRVIIQSPNWFDKLDQLDTLSLIHLLHLSKNKSFSTDYSNQIIDAIKESESWFFTINKLSLVSFLVEVMAKNEVFDAEILTKSSQLISETDIKDLSNNVNLVDMVNLIWNFGHFMMRNPSSKQCFSNINFVKFKKVVNNDKINKKLLVKLNKGLYLLGFDKNFLSTYNIDPELLVEDYEADVIDGFYTIELVKGERAFFDKYSLNQFQLINLPCSTKAIYLLNNLVSHFDESMSDLCNYVDFVSEIGRSLSRFLVVRPSDKWELIVEHNQHVIGLIPCEFVDYMCPDASDEFLRRLRLKYKNISVYKICRDDLIDIETEQGQLSFVCKYFPKNL